MIIIQFILFKIIHDPTIVYIQQQKKVMKNMKYTQKYPLWSRLNTDMSPERWQNRSRILNESWVVTYWHQKFKGDTKVSKDCSLDYVVLLIVFYEVARQYWRPILGIEKHLVLDHNVCGNESSNRRMWLCVHLRHIPSHFVLSSLSGLRLDSFLLDHERQRMR